MNGILISGMNPTLEPVFNDNLFVDVTGPARYPRSEMILEMQPLDIGILRD
jgi:hypothetical protein